MIAGLGWSYWAALTAALTGALALGLVFGAVFVFAFLAGAGIPGWWLAYLAMLARPAGAHGHEGPLEWYPTGRVVAWAAILAALVVVVAIPNLGTDGESFRAGLHDALARMLRVQTGTPVDTPLTLPGGTDPERFINFLVSVIPATAAVLATLTNLFNLWLAGRVVKFSGRLTRPWPQISAMRFPPLLTAALVLAIALSFAGRPDRGRRKHIFGEPAHGIRRTWLRSVALNHAGHDLAPILARRDLSRRADDWLAGIGTLPARRAGYDDRRACTRLAQARTASDYMRVTQSPTNQVQIEE